MQTLRPTGLLVGSVIVGVATVLVSALWLRAHNASEIIQAVVATSEIEPGVKLKAESLRLADWPKSSLPAGAVSSIEKLTNRVSQSKISPNELVLERMLLPIGSTGNLAAVISPGKRAITIPVNEVAGVAGFVFPGNYVDILLNSKDDSGHRSSRVVLQRVLVLAADQDRSVKDESKGRVVKAVTLQVSPQDAEKIDLARSIGTLSLILRSQDDPSADVIDAEVLQKKPSSKYLDQQSSPSSGVEIIRGTKRVIGVE